MVELSTRFTVEREATQKLISHISQLRQDVADEFEAARLIVPFLGAHWKNNRAEIGFWTPELVEQEIPPDRIFLELYTPLDEVDLTADEQRVIFQRDRIDMMRDGEYMWGVVEGMMPGSREQLGTLYQLVYQKRDGQWVTIHDHLAYSIPFGIFAPAELYDMQRLLDNRKDKAHFAKHLDTKPDPDGIERVQFPSNILQIHARYASQAGSIAGLSRIYQRIAKKIRNNEMLDPAEQHFIGYDAIQLMPIEPSIEYEAGPAFWEPVDDPAAEELPVLLRRPDMTNWGYDVVLSASPATNPALLESRRPDELLELIEVCHNFPGQPIKVMFDIVYGHIDNQARPLLNKAYFAGANMYGQNVNFLQPVVRAILIEMMRRKHNYGVDGIRVDGAQDFKWWDSETGDMIHDDDFLHLMNAIELDVAGVHYRPWMIFEDGRPWPHDDWELASTYREVTKLMPNVWQWGPLTFAHNTPFLFTFWTSKWWRIREMADIGREWITGCANHDTLRRGAQVPIDSRINTYLGDTLPQIIREAYDNAAAKLFDYAMMPGVPMDFINASMRAPWGFIRNTDDQYGVKVVSEEAAWLYWRLDTARYSRPDVFPRLKNLGFTDLEGLRRFIDILDKAVKTTDYSLDAMVRLMTNLYPPLAGPRLSIAMLKQIARAFMDDVHDFCNVRWYWHSQNPILAQYKRDVRNFRRQRPWLMNNLRVDEGFDYVHPAEGSVLFYGWRYAPNKSEQIAFIANMEGAPRRIPIMDLPIANIGATGWVVALATPGLDVSNISEIHALEDSQGVVFTRKAGG